MGTTEIGSCLGSISLKSFMGLSRDIYEPLVAPDRTAYKS